MDIGGVRIITATVAAAALVGSSPGPAAAEVWPAYPDLIERTVATHQSYLLAPDDSVRARTPLVSYPDLVERAVASVKLSRARSEEVSAVQAKSTESFDWGAAGIGASTTAALSLVLAACIGVLRRPGRRSIAA